MAFRELCKSNGHSLFQEISLWTSLLVFWTHSDGVKFSPMLCGDLKWEGNLKKNGDVCICKADSLCSTAETNPIL